MLYMKKVTILLLLCILTFQMHAQFCNIQIEKEYSPKNDVRSIAFTHDGKLLIATYAGVYEINNNEPKLYSSSEEMYSEALIADKAGRIWVSGWEKGTGVLNNENRKFEPIKEIPTSANIMYEDASGRIWIGMWRNGLMMYDNTNWVNFTTQENGFADNSILSIASDSNNLLWVGTYRGLSSFNGKNWHSYNINNSDLPDNNIYALAIGKNNRLWVGTCGGVVLMDKQGNIERVFNTSNSPIPDNVILSLAEDVHGQLWIGTSKGLICMKKSSWDIYTMENSNILENRIQELKLKNNKLYIGTSSGLSIFDIK